MIQAYKAGNTNFDTNGDSVLVPTSCRLNSKLNGSWELDMVHLLDSFGRWKFLEEGGVIAAPTFQSNKQLFRIGKLNKTGSGVTITAVPVFFDSADDCFLMDTRPTMKNGQEALDIMTAGSKYSGESDITEGSTAYFVRRNLMAAINGEEEPTFISRWGGEILYDNYKVIINKRVGGDYGVEVRYGKNMKGIDYQVDMSETITRIIPVAYNGYMLAGESPWVDSLNISKYPKIYTKEVKFDDVKLTEDASGEEEETFDTLEELRAELVMRCQEMYSAGADLPKVTIKVDMVELSKATDYSGYKDLEKAGLGDTVCCYHSKLDITTEARAIEITWDCIRNIAESVVLGEFAYDYFSELTTSLSAVEKIIGPGNTVIAERIRGVLNAINTQLRYQKNVAQRQDVRAILFEDMDSSSPMYGALSIGTQGFQIADKRTADEKDWDWTTAFTAKGGYADVLIAGILADKTGKSFWNLDTGEIQLTGVFRQFAANGKKSVDIENNQIKFYAWNVDGDYVGSIGSIKGNGPDENRVGTGVWSDWGDLFLLGYMNQDRSKVNTVFRFDSQKIESGEPPYIDNTASGKLNFIYHIGWNDNNVANEYRKVFLTIINGLVADWYAVKYTYNTNTGNWDETRL